MINWQNKPSFGRTAVIGTIELDLDPVRGKQGSYNLYISEIGAQANSGYGRPYLIYLIVADSIDKAEQEASRIVIASLLQKVDKYTKIIKQYEKIINIIKEK